LGLKLKWKDIISISIPLEQCGNKKGTVLYEEKKALNGFLMDLVHYGK
jgi:hypothetical protein